jgi:hypothetical protein
MMSVYTQQKKKKKRVQKNLYQVLTTGFPWGLGLGGYAKFSLFFNVFLQKEVCIAGRVAQLVATA